MKFKIHGMFLSLFLALAFCFSFSIEASAHQYTDSDGNIYTHGEDIYISAADVNHANEADMKKFVRHTAKHMDLIDKQDKLNETRQEKSREIAIFANKMVERAEEGEPPNVLNHGDVYTITTLVNLKGAIASHGLHPNLSGHKYDSSEDPLKTLLGDNIPEFSDTVDPECKTYDNGNRVACAVRLIPTELRVGPVTIMAGFHHAEEKPAFVQTPDCENFTPSVTAEQLENETDPKRKKELLKEFVKGIIDLTTEIFVGAAVEILQTAAGLDEQDRQGYIIGALQTEPIAKFFDKASCFREPALRYGSIYSFIMDPRSGVAFLSGNDFRRNGLSVSLTDPDPPSYDGKGNIEPNVLTAIHRTLTDTPPPDTPNLNDIGHGDSGFFTYHWAHPINTELNIPDYLDRNEVPGRALKESYIEVADIYADLPAIPVPILFVFGSGIYLEEEEEDDDGCSIAATGNTPQSMLLNLFLIASVLFSAVFLRKRV